MSYFFAFEVPDKTRAQIAAFVERRQSQIDPALNARWVAPENYHVTLKYLGDISAELVDAAAKKAIITMNAPVFKSYIKPLLIEQKPVALFPAGKPAVLWVEIIPTGTLKNLALQMEVIQSENGVCRDHRPFNPHITLAYCKPEAEVGPLLLNEQTFEVFAVSRFVLMQTSPQAERVKEGKARYNIVHTFPFGNSQS